MRLASTVPNELVIRLGPPASARRTLPLLLTTTAPLRTLRASTLAKRLLTSSAP